MSVEYASAGGGGGGSAGGGGGGSAETQARASQQEWKEESKEELTWSRPALGTLGARLVCAGYLIYPLPPARGGGGGGGGGHAQGNVSAGVGAGERCRVVCVGVVDAYGPGHWWASIGPPFARPECLTLLEGYLRQEQGQGGCNGHEHARHVQLGVGGYGKRGPDSKSTDVPLRTLSPSSPTHHALAHRGGGGGVGTHPVAAEAPLASSPGGAGGGGRLMMAGWLFRRRMLLPGTRKRCFQLRVCY